MNTSIHTVVFLFLSLLFPASLIHAGIEEGVSAYNQGDHATAYKEFLPIAESGNKKAQLLLGLMYDNGLGIGRDYKQAAQWYSRAAEQGQPRAQFNLGLMYESGEGINADKAMALSWIRKSAEQGYAEAQDKLGHIYEDGHYVAQDFVHSHLWFSLAASDGIQESIDSKNRIAAQLNQDQLDESQRMVEMWQNVFKSVF